MGSMKSSHQVQSVHPHASLNGYRVYFSGTLEECKAFSPDWSSKELRNITYKARSTIIREVASAKAVGKSKIYYHHKELLRPLEL